MSTWRVTQRMNETTDLIVPSSDSNAFETSVSAKDSTDCQSTTSMPLMEWKEMGFKKDDVLYRLLGIAQREVFLHGKEGCQMS